MSVGDFEALTSAAGSTLKKTVIHIGNDLPRLLPMLDRLVAVQDLSLCCRPYQFAGLTQPHNAPVLPHLRRLDLRAQRSDMNYLMNWFTRSTYPGLHTLAIDGHQSIDLRRLREFLAVHGANLRSLELRGLLSMAGLGQVHAHVPRTEHLRVSRHHINVVHMLEGLPASVQDITLSRMSKDGLQFVAFLEEMLQAIEQIPKQHALSAFRLKREYKFVDRDSLTWDEEFERLQEVNYMAWCESRESLAVLAQRIEAYGVQLLDEDGTRLQDYLTQERLGGS